MGTRIDEDNDEGSISIQHDIPNSSSSAISDHVQDDRLEALIDTFPKNSSSSYLPLESQQQLLEAGSNPQNYEREAGYKHQYSDSIGEFGLVLS